MVAMPIATYASSVWLEKIEHVIVRRHLMAAQRSLLIMITRATRTTSTVAMQAIAGIAPLDLSIIEQGLKNKVRRNQTVTWANYTYIQQKLNGSINIREEFKKIEIEIKRAWQQRWMEDAHGRQTFRFIPSVEFASTNSWFKPNRECTYILTGYGSINSTLFRRGAEETNVCPVCKNSKETVEHILLECPGYQDKRYQEIMQVKEINQLLVETKEKFVRLNNYAKEIFNIRKNYL